MLIKQLKKIRTKDAYAKVLSLEERVKNFLKGQNDDGVVYCMDENRLKYLYLPSNLETFNPVIAKDKDGNPIIVNGKELKLLPLPKTNAIKNPTLMRSMHLLRNLVNELLLKGIIDDRTRIHIELAREINDANKRKAWKEWQDKLRDEKEDAIERIKELYMAECGKDVEPTEDDVMRYLLWQEQENKEIYEDEGRNIAISDIIGPDPKYDIEHIIPRSRSWDNSRMNKVLCSKKFNREIKKNQIPFELGKEKHEQILQRISHWKKRYEELDGKIKNMNPSRIVDPDTRNKAIVKKHLMIFERDYWKGKYERFTMEEVPEGFKNSQTSDTGLITRFAHIYLSCLFRTEAGNSNVREVNGVAVSEFRKAWGLQNDYEEKLRSNHIHHCIDAVVIACMTKEKYDAFAEEWRKAEEEGKYYLKEKMGKYKPWDNFTRDVLKLENQVLIVHTHKDNVSKQTFKKVKKRGRVQYLVEYETDANGKFKRDERGKKIPKRDANGKPVFKRDENGKPIPKFQQGDTVRGSLHKDTFYGAIKEPKRDEETCRLKRNEDGTLILKKNKKGEEEIAFVIRKNLADLDDADLKKIVDCKVKEIVMEGRKKEKELKKKIEELKQLKNTEGEERSRLLDAEISAIKHKIDNELYVIPPKKGKTKFTPIRKVRIKAHLDEPLPEFKLHRDVKRNPDGSEKYPHKKWIYVRNDENYGMAFYEKEDRSKRAAQVVKMIDAAKYFNKSSDYRKEHPLIPEKKGMKLKGFLKPRTLVLFYKNNPEELWELDKASLSKRLYYVRKTSKKGQVTFQFHQEARNDNQLKEDYRKEHGKEPPQTYINGESSIDFNRLPIPKLLLNPVNMKMLIEGIDFKITLTGKIEKL